MNTGLRWMAYATLGALLAGLPVGAGAEMARWEIDPDHSLIEFRVPHMVVSKTSGRFTDYKGFVDMDADAKTIHAIEATINAASVNTNHDKRDTHLRNPDFLDVKQYPTMTYKMKSVKQQGDTYTIVGDFTLRGVTKEITLVSTFNGVAKDPWGGTRAGFSAEGKLNRKDFGMIWDKTLDNGGLVVGNEVHVRLEIECIKQSKP